MPDLRLAYMQSNEATLRDLNTLRKALPEPSIAWLRYLKVPFFSCVLIASLPVGGYAGTITGFDWIGPIIWSGSFLVSWQLWNLVILRWAMRSALRDYAKYRPERSAELYLDEIGMHFKDEVSELQLKWAAVQAVVPARHGIGIIADMVVYYVPTSAFQNDDAKSSFIETIQSRKQGNMGRA